MKSTTSTTAADPSPALPYLLNSFDIFQVTDPAKIFDLLQNYTSKSLTAKQVNTGGITQFDSNLTVLNSQADLKQTYSASLGIKGKYGFYSGSVSAKFSTSYAQSVSSFNSLFSAQISCASANLSFSDQTTIRSYLNSDLLAALDAIDSAQAAHDFVTTYGSHLITGVTLGGLLVISVQANTTSISDQTTVSGAVSGAYNAVASVSVVATAAASLSSYNSTYSLTQSVVAIGGNPTLAAKINPTDQSTIDTWAATTANNSVCGLASVKDFSKITTSATAAGILSNYLNYRILVQSLNQPTIVVGQQLISSQGATLQVPAPVGYRIVAGGACVGLGSDNFFLSMYPVINSNGAITNWCGATTHGDSAPTSTDVIQVFALAIYDPWNLLDISVVTQTGKNSGSGKDSATATISSGYTMVGGGCLNTVNDNGNSKYMYASYPASPSTWTATNSDYAVPATNVTLTAYAIGLKDTLGWLTFSTAITQSPASVLQEYGRNTASPGGPLISGGSNVAYPSSWGSLTQASYPSSANTWMEANQDLNGHGCSTTAAAYAMTLTVTPTWQS